MRLTGVEDVNAALADLKPYTTTLNAGKEFYGLKKKGVVEQFGRYVEPKDVPDEFTILPGGQAQGLRAVPKQVSIFNYLAPGASAGSASRVAGPSIASTPALNVHRWNTTRDTSLLLSVLVTHFEGRAPQSSAEVRRICTLMPVSDEGKIWDGGKLKKRAKEVLKEMNLCMVMRIKKMVRLCAALFILSSLSY